MNVVEWNINSIVFIILTLTIFEMIRCYAIITIDLLFNMVIRLANNSLKIWLHYQYIWVHLKYIMKLLSQLISWLCSVHANLLNVRWILFINYAQMYATSIWNNSSPLDILPENPIRKIPLHTLKSAEFHNIKPLKLCNLWRD